MNFDPVVRLIAYHGAINKLDVSTIEAMFAEQAVYDSGGLGGVVNGRGPIMEGFRRYFDTYPDQVAVDSVVEALDGLRVRSEWSLTAPAYWREAHSRWRGNSDIRRIGKDPPRRGHR